MAEPPFFLWTMKFFARCASLSVLGFWLSPFSCFAQDASPTPEPSPIAPLTLEQQTLGTLQDIRYCCLFLCGSVVGGVSLMAFRGRWTQ